MFNTLNFDIPLLIKIMTYCKNDFLTIDEMTVNAQYILNYLMGKGWTKNAVCGMLGNMETESTINPCIWQNLDSGNMNGGYGLVQWTPTTKITDWLDANGYSWTSLDGQIERILYEVANGLQWISTSEYPMTFQDFTISTQTPEYLADAFLKCYERPADQTQPDRGTQARYWFDNLTGDGTVHCDFIYPTDIHEVYSGFLPPDRPDHYGVDFSGDGYHEIKASADGIVSRSDVSTTYGEVVYIQSTIDGQLYETVYAHMQTGSRTVALNDTVKQGQVIGIMGSTGDSTGQHLHFELHVGGWTEDKSNAVDPIPYLCDESDTGTSTSENRVIALLLCDALNGWKY